MLFPSVHPEQQFMELEPEMLATETIVPVYFAMEDDELLSIYTQTLTSSSSQGSLSAAEGRELSGADLFLYYTPKIYNNTWCGTKIFKSNFMFLCSVAAYGHSQRLPDGHQWSSE